MTSWNGRLRAGGLEARTPRGRRAVVVGIALAGLHGRPVLGQASGGAPTIGGKFTLVGGDGKPVSDRDLRGRYLLVFFGYTGCPDICPATLSKIARVLTLLPPGGAAVSAVFITVDPARDTPALIGAYTRLFSPGIIGLSGSPAAIAQVAAAYHVYVGPRDPRTGAIAHSALIYLMGPDGRFITVFPDNETAQAIAAAIGALRGG